MAVTAAASVIVSSRRPPSSLAKRRARQVSNCTAGVNGTEEDRRYDDGLAFIHVTKSGGTSMRSFVRDLANSCGYTPYVEELPPWRDLSEERRSDVQVFGGTSHLGYYDLLRTWPGDHDNKAFFTQLRHPWDRLASDYYYAKNLGPLHHLYDLTQSQNVTEWVSSTRDGGMLSYFVPIGAFSSKQRRCCFNGRDLDRVKTLLRTRFVVIGIVEEPRMTVEVLRCRVPWIRRAMLNNPSLADVPHLNPRMVQYNVSRAGDDVVRALFPLDFELYHTARDLLHEYHAECLERGLI